MTIFNEGKYQANTMVNDGGPQLHLQIYILYEKSHVRFTYSKTSKVQSKDLITSF